MPTPDCFRTPCRERHSKFIKKQPKRMSMSSINPSVVSSGKKPKNLCRGSVVGGSSYLPIEKEEGCQEEDSQQGVVHKRSLKQKQNQDTDTF
jgi:hypothetical protein